MTLPGPSQRQSGSVESPGRETRIEQAAAWTARSFPSDGLMSLVLLAFIIEALDRLVMLVWRTRVYRCLWRLVSRSRSDVNRLERRVIACNSLDEIIGGAGLLVAARPLAGERAAARKRLAKLERSARTYAASLKRSARGRARSKAKFDSEKMQQFDSLKQQIDELPLEDRLLFHEDACVLFNQAKEHPERLVEAARRVRTEPGTRGKPEARALKTYVLKLGIVFETATGRPWRSPMYFDEIRDSLRGDFADLVRAAWPTSLWNPSDSTLWIFLRRLRKEKGEDEALLREEKERILAQWRKSIAPYVPSR